MIFTNNYYVVENNYVLHATEELLNQRSWLCCYYNYAIYMYMAHGIV